MLLEIAAVGCYDAAWAATLEQISGKYGSTKNILTQKLVFMV